MSNRLELNIADNIAHVQLNRPDKLNALDIPMFDAIWETGQQLKTNPDVRCVILSGKGKGFCAGMDLSNFMNPNIDFNAKLDQREGTLANYWQRVAWVWRELPMPVIAAVHGVAFGGGLQIMMGADIKYIHAETRLSIMEMKWGLIPDMAGNVLAQGLVRDDILRELTYTNRMFSGQQAVEYGFATHVSENPLEEAQALAKEIIYKSPSAIRAAKTLFNANIGTRAEELLHRETELQKQIIGRKHQMEAVQAAMEKRLPNFE